MAETVGYLAASELYAPSGDVLDAVAITPAPRSGQTASGYGLRVPTCYMVHVTGGRSGARWLRVYAVVIGNSGSLYVRTGGKRRFLSSDVEHVIERARDRDAAGRA
ncbi:hypothetical protein SEA_GUYFAGIERI_82 [Rhodococcus phage GuyFagieri]|nr:hypothetical protein SEA_GUYFAGIERI_82 [Rhodococcus phage GuyFagieri]